MNKIQCISSRFKVLIRGNKRSRLVQNSALSIHSPSLLHLADGCRAPRLPSHTLTEMAETGANMYTVVQIQIQGLSGSGACMTFSLTLHLFRDPTRCACAHSSFCPHISIFIYYVRAGCIQKNSKKQVLNLRLLGLTAPIIARTFTREGVDERRKLKHCHASRIQGSNQVA